jgi:hypothetical protein
LQKDKPKNRLQDILLRKEDPTIDQMLKRQQKEAEEYFLDASLEFLAIFETDQDFVMQGFVTDKGPLIRSFQDFRDAGGYYAECSL